MQEQEANYGAKECNTNIASKSVEDKLSEGTVKKESREVN